MTLIDIITFGTPFGSRYAHEDMSFTSDFNLAANFKRQVAKLVHQLKSNLSPNDCPEEEEENEGKPDSIENVPVLLMLSNLRCDFMKTRYPADDLVLPGLRTLNVTSITPFELMWSSLRLHVMKSCNANATGNFYSLELNGTMQPLEAEECMVQSSLRSAAKSSSHALPILANSTTVGTLNSCKQSFCNKENSVELRFVWHRNVFKMHTYDSNKLLMTPSTATTTPRPATSATTVTPDPATKKRNALMLTNSTPIGIIHSCKQSSDGMERLVEGQRIRLLRRFQEVVDIFVRNFERTADKFKQLLDELENLRRKEYEGMRTVGQLDCSIPKHPGMVIFKKNFGALRPEYKRFQGQERCKWEKKVEKLLNEIMSVKSSTEWSFAKGKEGEQPCWKNYDVWINIVDFEYRDNILSTKGPKMHAKIEEKQYEVKTRIAALHVLVDDYSTTLNSHNAEPVTRPSEISGKIYPSTAEIKEIKTKYIGQYVAFKTEVTALQHQTSMKIDDFHTINAEALKVYKSFSEYVIKKTKLRSDLDHQLTRAFNDVLHTCGGITEVLELSTKNDYTLSDTFVEDVLLTIQPTNEAESRNELEDANASCAQDLISWEAKYEIFKTRSRNLHNRLKSDFLDKQKWLTSVQIKRTTCEKLMGFYQRRKKMYSRLNLKSKRILNEEKKCMIGELEEMKRGLEKMAADFDTDSRRG